jgi:hypothetical protein
VGEARRKFSTKAASSIKKLMLGSAKARSMAGRQMEEDLGLKEGR